MPAAPEAPRIPWLAAGTPDIAPPQIPWLTDESACPEGWGWVELSPGLNGCDPYPTGYIEDCGPTGAHFPGEAGCRDLDSGDTEWPSDLPATNVLYVREGASGGDGTIDAPFATLPEALAAAIEGTTIALAPGRYDTGQGAERTDFGPGVFETLSKVLVDGVHIRGTSVARTTLFSTRPAPSTGDFAMLQAESTGVEISDLRFESPHPAIDAFGGALVARRIVLDGTYSGLIAGVGGTASFEDVIARDTSGPFAVGAVSGANVTVRRAVLDVGSDVAALAAQAGSSLTLESVLVAGAEGGVITVQGAHTEVSFFAAHTAVGLQSDGAGSRLEGRWLAFTGTTAVSLGNGGTARVEDLVSRASESLYAFLYAALDSELVAHRSLLVGGGCSLSEGTVELGDIVCVNAGSSGVLSSRGGSTRVSRADLSIGYGGLQTSTGGQLEATDVRIHDLGTQPIAYAIGADTGSITLERGDVSRRTLGVDATNGSEVTLTDVSMHDLLVTVADFGTTGIVAREGGTVSGSRILIDGVAGRGVVASSSGALDLADLVLRDLHGPPGATSGIAVAGDAAPSTFSRIEIGEVLELGAVLVGSARAEDLAIHDISPGADGAPGYGMLVATAVDGTAPAVTGARVTIRDVATVGLALSGDADGATGRLSLTLTDLRVERAGRTPEGGAGILASGAADLGVTGLVVRDTASVGVMSRQGASITLADGLIASATTCTSSESPLDLTTVATDACGTAPVTWSPPER